jgi:two-component system, OmpR family, alkaline phosphatase synthesis response regulator PhoP
MKKLLIIDDEEIILKALSSQFDPKEIKVFTAGNGVDGLKLAKKEHPHLILLDLIMPKMDGLEMLKKLRKDKWGKNVDVLVLSNLNDTERISQAVALGVFEYMVKVDWNVNDVVKKIQASLGFDGKKPSLAKKR